MNQFKLRLGASLHFLIAIGHVACLFFLEKAFKAYGIWELMKFLCLGQVWALYVITVFLAIDFALAGLYALAASGDIIKLPLQHLAIITINSAAAQFFVNRLKEEIAYYEENKEYFGFYIGRKI